MCPGVPLQLVAARETFPTENPVTDEGPLAGVQPDVSSEQRRFPERLLAAGDVTDVLPLPHLAGPAECTENKEGVKMFQILLFCAETFDFQKQKLYF